jgi:hypothetical protein
MEWEKETLEQQLEGCHQACSPRLPALLQPVQVERYLRETCPPHIILPIRVVVTALVDLEDASNLEVVSTTADMTATVIMYVFSAQ